jgi:hypothetical protein
MLSQLFCIRFYRICCNRYHAWVAPIQQLLLGSISETEQDFHIPTLNTESRKEHQPN